jgi:hypothetical protein
MSRYVRARLCPDESNEFATAAQPKTEAPRSRASFRLALDRLLAEAKGSPILLDQI